ncbi:MAG: ATP-binding cassette domain-containing protein [Candidatus Babeliales bacterium]|jgi:phospholipid/cholesterol/gamma-HCH transport system ATP-binding protein
MIIVKDLKKRFTQNGPFITDGVNLEIPNGKMTCIIGRSGEGKSVLLKQIIGLIRPTSGQIIIDDIDVTALSDKELTKIFKKMGYVFQFAALLDSLNVLENVGLPLLEKGMSLKEVEPIVRQKLALVDLSADETLHKYPSELSGGMKKRVGLARTLVTEPEIILYDEPTTGLDPITTRIIHELMASMQKSSRLLLWLFHTTLKFLNMLTRLRYLKTAKFNILAMLQLSGKATTRTSTSLFTAFQKVQSRLS